MATLRPSLASLPQEILLKIVAFACANESGDGFDVKELLRLSHINSAFRHAIISHGFLWRLVSVRPRSPQASHVDDLLRLIVSRPDCANHVQELCISDTDLRADTLALVLAKCPRLAKCNATHCRRLRLPDLLQALESWPPPPTPPEEGDTEPPVRMALELDDAGQKGAGYDGDAAWFLKAKLRAHGISLDLPMPCLQPGTYEYECKEMQTCVRCTKKRCCARPLPRCDECSNRACPECLEMTRCRICVRILCAECTKMPSCDNCGPVCEECGSVVECDFCASTLCVAHAGDGPLRCDTCGSVACFRCDRDWSPPCGDCAKIRCPNCEVEGLTECERRGCEVCRECANLCRCRFCLSQWMDELDFGDREDYDEWRYGTIDFADDDEERSYGSGADSDD